MDALCVPVGPHQEAEQKDGIYQPRDQMVRINGQRCCRIDLETWRLQQEENRALEAQRFDARQVEHTKRMASAPLSEQLATAQEQLKRYRNKLATSAKHLKQANQRAAAAELRVREIEPQLHALEAAAESDSHKIENYESHVRMWAARAYELGYADQ